MTFFKGLSLVLEWVCAGWMWVFVFKYTSYFNQHSGFVVLLAILSVSLLVGTLTNND